MNTKRVFTAAVAIASFAILGGCNEDGKPGSSGISGLFSKGCSGSFSEELKCYADKYLLDNDKTKINKIQEKCQLAINSASQDIETSAQCRAVYMVINMPGAVKWLGKPEPYPSKQNWEFFKNTSDQIRADEYAWCLSEKFSKINNSILGGLMDISMSCNSLDAFQSIYGDVGTDDYGKIMRMHLSLKPSGSG